MTGEEIPTAIEELSGDSKDNELVNPENESISNVENDGQASNEEESTAPEEKAFETEEEESSNADEASADILKAPALKAAPVSYVDENNETHTITEYEELSGSTSEVTLGQSGTESWYVLKGQISFDGAV